MENVIIQKVEEIFTSIDIHKSIFVCDNAIIKQVHTLLLQNDYPVCTMLDIQKFNTTNYRILLLDDSLLDEIWETNVLSKVKDITAILYLNTTKRVFMDNHVREFFL